MHTRAGLMAVAASICCLFGLRAHATETQHDAALQRGEHIARLVCSACHVVAADQEFPPLLRPPAPSFEEIANRPDASVETVRRFVIETHWDMKTLPAQMPNQMLSKAEATAVARYLLSLRRH
jgi:mono/diheme cytochrome c family protein